MSLYSTTSQNNVTNTLINKRNVLVIGEIGTGKSWLLNQLIGKPVFRSCWGVDATTRNIQTEEREITFKDADENTITYTIRATDTPGFLQTSNARSNLNEIMKLIRETRVHQIIILVAHGKTTASFYNNLEILEKCMNGLVDSSVMLVVNQVPNACNPRGKDHSEAAKTQPSTNDQHIEMINQRIKEKLKFAFSAVENLAKEQTAEDEKENKTKIEHMRSIIYNSIAYSHKVKTWEEIWLQISPIKKTAGGYGVEFDQDDEYDDYGAPLIKQKDLVSMRSEELEKRKVTCRQKIALENILNNKPAQKAENTSLVDSKRASNSLEDNKLIYNRLLSIASLEKYLSENANVKIKNEIKELLALVSTDEDLLQKIQNDSTVYERHASIYTERVRFLNYSI